MPIYKNPITIVQGAPTPSAEPSIITYRGTSTPTKIHTAVAGQYITANETYAHGRAMSDETTYFSNNMCDANTYRVCVKFKVRAKSVDWGVLISGGNHSYKPIPTPLYNRGSKTITFEYRDGNKSSLNDVYLADVLELGAWYYAVSYFIKNEKLLCCTLYDESGVLVAAKAAKMEIPYNISAPLYIGGEGDNANTTAADTDIDIANTFIEKNGSVLWGKTNAKTQDMGVFRFDDISFFTRCEYIQSDGSGQYIETDYIPNSNTEFYMEYTPLQGVSTSNVGSFFGTFDTASYRLVCSTYPDTAGGSLFLGSNLYNPRIVANQRQVLSFESGALTTPSGTQSATNNIGNHITHPLILLARYYDGDSPKVKEFAKAKLHEYKIKESGTLVRDFVPCYHTATGIIGMFDTVNNKFYTNAGTGEFIKGADV